ncbi:MAG: hypothetical protein PHO45_02495 [Victivallaceae bacterium]|nr:hypothetical protein [Victivallaceae bacterium]
MKFKKRTRQKVVDRQDVTLIKLLVAIAIIAILATMLLPALNKARKKTRTITSTSNMKRNWHILKSYDSNKNDIIIPSVLFTSYWGKLLRTQGYLKDIGFFDQGEPVSLRWHPKILSCPSQTIPLNNYATTRVNSCASYHYGLNHNISRSCTKNAINNGSAYVVKLTSIRKSSSIAWLFDGNCYLVNAYSNVMSGGASTDIARNFSTSHDDALNVLFLDGIPDAGRVRSC